MKYLRQFSTEKLDVAPFIDAQGRLAGESLVVGFKRLAAGLSTQADISSILLSWSIEGWLEPQKAGAPHRWMKIQAHATLPWTCQRCLHAVYMPLEVERRIRWVNDENQAAELDAVLDDDVLAIVSHLDVMVLIEDECIMAEPLVPKHDICPVPLVMSASDGNEAELDKQEKTTSNPFAALAALKNRGNQD